MKKVFLTMLILVLAVCVFAETNVAIVFATGGLGDKSFNDAAMEGMKMAKEQYAIEYDFAEPSAITEYETYLAQFANSEKYDLIISIGFDQADALTKISERFPKQNFAIIDMVVMNPNVASYVFKEQERGFMVGYASALMTVKTDDVRINEDKIVGVIGGMKIPLIDANIAGFMTGVNYANNGVKAIHAYVNHWADPAKGKELTLSMYEQGADIVWGAAGRSGLGVINASKEKNFYSIGADSDQGYLAPENVLTNGMKRVDNTVCIAIKDVIDGKFEGKIYSLGIKEDALGYSVNILPEDVIKELEIAKEKIIAGEIIIPATIEEVK